MPDPRSESLDGETIDLSPALLRYMAALLRQGAHEIFRRICEDHNEESETALQALSPEERDSLMRDFYTWNRSPQDFEPGHFTFQASVASLACAVRLEALAQQKEVAPHAQT